MRTAWPKATLASGVDPVSVWLHFPLIRQTLGTLLAIEDSGPARGAWVTSIFSLIIALCCDLSEGRE